MLIRYRRSVTSLLFICVICILVYEMHSGKDEIIDYQKKLRFGHISGRNKHILLWTPFFNSKTWYTGQNFIDKTVTIFQLSNSFICSWVLTKLTSKIEDQNKLPKSVEYYKFHPNSQNYSKNFKIHLVSIQLLVKHKVFLNERNIFFIREICLLLHKMRFRRGWMIVTTFFNHFFLWKLVILGVMVNNLLINR
jgi:hypothetical protein